MATNGTLLGVHVFLGKKKLGAGVRVEVTADEVTIYQSKNPGSRELSRWTIVETVKDLMAWDVDRDGERARLVAQSGCGCGGIKPYAPDESYSGALV